jgi:hypothetical protein
VADFGGEGFNPSSLLGTAPTDGLPLGSFDACRVVLSLVVAVESAQAIKENVVRVTFSRAVLLDGLETLGDALRAANYALSVPAGQTGVDEVQVREVIAVVGSATQVDVITDRPLSHYPAQYTVTVSNVESDTGFPLSALEYAFTFDGLRDKRVPALPELATGARDIANPQTLSGALDPVRGIDLATLGSIPTDDTGDYAFDEGLTYLKKRVYRRLVSKLGGFYHLPTYGLGIPQRLKQLARTEVLRDLQDEATQQIQQEPDVAEASVFLTTERANGSMLLRVNVSVKSKGRQAAFSFPFRLGD